MKPNTISAPRSRGSKLGRALLWVFALAVLLVSVAAVYDTYARAAAPRRYPAPGAFVTVRGGQMHYLCQGSGEPTLVLQAGIGGGALDWSPIMGVLSQQNRVCAFDRFGQDYSDPAPTPRQFGTGADELHEALAELGIERPVVVGHSLGGALVQIYAAKYETSGLILIDGLTTGDVDAVVERLGSYQALNGLAPLGLLRPLGHLLVHPSYSGSLRQQMIALRSHSKALLAMTAEGATAGATAGAELREAEAKLAVPMLLIGAAQSDVPGLPKGQLARSLQAMAGRRQRASFVLVPEARHYPHADQPEVVAEAIMTWLEGIGHQ